MIDITTTGQWCLYTSYYRPRVFTMDASQNLFLFVSTGKSEFWGLTWLKQFQKWTCFYFVIFDCVWYFTHIWAKANLENYNLKLQHLQSYYKTTVAWCVCRFPVPNNKKEYKRSPRSVRNQRKSGGWNGSKDVHSREERKHEGKQKLCLKQSNKGEWPQRQSLVPLSAMLTR